MVGARSRRRQLARVTLGVLALAGGGCELNLETEGVTATETRTFQVTGQPDVVLQTFDGSIEVHSWDRDSIEVEIEKRAMEQRFLDEMKISAEQDGNRII